VYLFIVGYIGAFVLTALYEPLFAPYTPAQLENRHNCSSAYRYKLYQYVLTSPINNLPFILPAIYCTGKIIIIIIIIIIINNNYNNNNNNNNYNK